MEFSLLNLKNFGTLFPNKIINAVEYEGVVNQYIDDKLGSVNKNINGLSGNELIEKKKKYLNTYIMPLMYLLFSKYYIEYNNLNILVNKNNSILQEFNNLKLFYAYNNPIINSVNVYFYKKYSGLNKNNGNKEKKENKSLIDIDSLTIMQNNKTEIVSNLTDYINNLTFENKKITYKKTLEKTITSLTDEMNKAIIKLNGEAEYKSINNKKQFDELNYTKNKQPKNSENTTSKNSENTTSKANKNKQPNINKNKQPNINKEKIDYNQQIDEINNFIKGILNKVIYYHEKTGNESKLISDINNILKYASSILIKTKIASSIIININISGIKPIINSLTEIKEIYENQIKLYKNYISSNKSNNNIKNITYDNLIEKTKTYYDSIKNIDIIKNKKDNNKNTQNNIFINQLCNFIFYDNFLTNKFIQKNKNNNNKNNKNKLDDILPKLKKYKEILKLNLNSKNTKNSIINNDTLKKFLKNEKELFQNFLTEIGAGSTSEKNKTNYDALKIQNNIFDKINKDLIEINKDLKEIENFTNTLIPNNYNDAKLKIDNLNNIIKEVNSNKKKALINTSDIATININNIYKKRVPQDVDYTKNGKILDSSIQNINNSISSLKEAIDNKKSADQSKFVKYANYWINTYSKIIKNEFPDNYENSSYIEIIPVFDRPININIRKCVNNLYDSFIKIDTKLINDINESTKKIQKNRLMFYLTQDDKFQKIKLNNMNSLNKLIPSYISSFKNKNKNAKQNLFINQIKNDNKSIGNNPDIQQFLNTIYTYNDTLIANLASKINNKLITKGNQLNTQISNFKTQIDELFNKIKKNTPSTINNKTPNLNNKNKNLIYIPAYTDVIQLYFMNLVFIKLLYTNS